MQAAIFILRHIVAVAPFGTISLRCWPGMMRLTDPRFLSDWDAQRLSLLAQVYLTISSISPAI
jgi:hypothetical protein